MKSTAIACAIAAATLSFGSLSYAQDDNRRGGHRQGAYEQRGHDGHARGEHRGQRAHEARIQRHDVRDQRHEARRDMREAQRDYREARRDFRGAGERHHDGYGARGSHFYRGGYIPHHYRQTQYVVNDWRHHRLSAPPHGHQWVQVGGDYALIAIATGLIAHLLINQ